MNEKVNSFEFYHVDSKLVSVYTRALSGLNSNGRTRIHKKARSKEWQRTLEVLTLAHSQHKVTAITRGENLVSTRNDHSHEVTRCSLAGQTYNVIRIM